MKNKSLGEVKLSAVFIAVLVLGCSAMFSSTNASPDMEVNETIEQNK